MKSVGEPFEDPETRQDTPRPKIFVGPRYRALVEEVLRRVTTQNDTVPTMVKGPFQGTLEVRGSDGPQPTPHCFRRVVTVSTTV